MNGDQRLVSPGERMIGGGVSVARLILLLAAALCLLWSPPASFTPAGAATAQTALADHDHDAADHGAHDRHSGHHHDGIAADHSHDGGAVAAFPMLQLYAASPDWYGPLSVLADPGWPNALERPPRAAAAS